MEAISSSAFVSKLSEKIPVLYAPHSSIRSPNKVIGSLKFRDTAPWACGSRVLALAREVSDEGGEEIRFENNGSSLISQKSTSLSQVLHRNHSIQYAHFFRACSVWFWGNLEIERN